MNVESRVRVLEKNKKKIGLADLTHKLNGKTSRKILFFSFL